MADDPDNNITWVVLAIVGTLVIIICAILLAVFCCCRFCPNGPGFGGGGGGGGGCMPAGGTQYVMVGQPAVGVNQVAPVGGGGTTTVNTGDGTHPVPDPTFMSDFQSGGRVKFGSNGLMDDKMRVIKLEKDDPVHAVRSVVKEHMGGPELEQVEDPNKVPTVQKPPNPDEKVYVLNDERNYARGGRGESVPYEIMRSRDPGFDQ